MTAITLPSIQRASVHTTAPTETAAPDWPPTQWTRLRWGVRATLLLGVAASIAANVLHARPNPISQSIAAWPPLALLLTVELIARIPVHRQIVAVARLLVTTGLAGIAAWVSYWHMTGVALRYGETGASAYLLPLSVDGLIIVASICLVEIGGRILHTQTADQQAHPAPSQAATHPGNPEPFRPYGDPPRPNGPPPAAPPSAAASDTRAMSTTADTPATQTASPAVPKASASPNEPAPTTDNAEPAAAPGTPPRSVTSVPDNDDEEDVPAGTGEAIAYWQRRQPGIDIDTLAVRVGRSTRQVRRHLNNASKATGDRPVNGRARPALADSLRTE